MSPEESRPAEGKTRISSLRELEKAVEDLKLAFALAEARIDDAARLMHRAAKNLNYAVIMVAISGICMIAVAIWDFVK